MDQRICREVPLQYANDTNFKHQGVGCIVLSSDNKILLQHRDVFAPTYPDHIALFGGGIEKGETALQAIIRELKEELGALIPSQNLITLGTVLEPETDYQSLVFMYFWHDKNGSITGCYEGKPKYMNDPTILYSHPKVMNDVLWGIEACQKQGLLK